MSLIEQFNEKLHKVRTTDEAYTPTGRWYTQLVTRINSIFDIFVDTQEQVLDTQTVPLVNSGDNDLLRDVVGNKEDTSFSGGSHTGNPSVVGHLKAGYYHIHSSAKVAPSLANSIVLTSSASAWTLGDKVQIIPAEGAGSMTKWFDVHWILVHSISTTDEYELVLWANDDTEIGRIAFVKTATMAQEGNLPIQIPPQTPGTKISANVARKGGSATVGIKLYYHEYPDIT
jgi:hypothetical protein